MRTLIGFLTIVTAIVAAEVDWSMLDELVASYISKGAFPGAAIRVSNKTHTLYSKNYGHLSLNPSGFGSPSVTNDTIYDIASLTKITGTLGCIMHLVDVGTINVDDLVIKYVP